MKSVMASKSSTHCLRDCSMREKSRAFSKGDGGVACQRFHQLAFDVRELVRDVGHGQRADQIAFASR